MRTDDMGFGKLGRFGFIGSRDFPDHTGILDGCGKILGNRRAGFLEGVVGNRCTVTGTRFNDDFTAKADQLSDNFDGRGNTRSSPGVRSFGIAILMASSLPNDRSFFIMSPTRCLQASAQGVMTAQRYLRKVALPFR